jgi:predicted dehydrogenase
MLGGMQSHLTVLASDHRLECSLSPVDSLRSYAVNEGTFGDEYMMEKLSGQAGWSTPMPDELWCSGQQGLLQSVSDHLRTGERSDVDGELGLEVVRIIYAAYRSAAEGRRITLAD